MIEWDRVVSICDMVIITVIIDQCLCCHHWIQLINIIYFNIYIDKKIIICCISVISNSTTATAFRIYFCHIMLITIHNNNNMKIMIHCLPSIS